MMRGYGEDERWCANVDLSRPTAAPASKICHGFTMAAPLVEMLRPAPNPPGVLGSLVRLSGGGDARAGRPRTREGRNMLEPWDLLSADEGPRGGPSCLLYPNSGWHG